MSESEDKLLLLKKKSLLSATVHKGIVVWLEANSAQKLLARQRFKIVFKHINLISKEFLTAWIEYVFLKKFSWAIKDQAEDSIMLLSEKLNSTYQQMTTGMNDLSFKLLVVYLVRVAAQFLESNADIEVDPTLESEICVIFYHTVIGIPVGTKTFAVLERQLVNPLSKFQIFGLLK